MKRFIQTSLIVFAGISLSMAQINLLSDQITFRDYYNAGQTTTHYGNLSLDGGDYGTGQGWLYSNAAICNGWGWFSDWLLVGWSLEVYGDLYCYGGKYFIQPHPTDNTKVISYVAVEAGEALTLARGTATTKGGEIEIALPEHFSLVTSADVPLTVLLTPEKAPAVLYVKQKSKDKITIALGPENYSKFGDVDFNYQVTGVRDGYEDLKAIRDVSSLRDTTNISPKRKALMEKVKKIAAREKAKLEGSKGKK